MGICRDDKKEISNVKRDIENSTGFQYKMKLFSIINRWEKGDFSQTVESITFMEPSRWRYWQGDGTFIARRGKAVYKRNEE